MEVSEVKDILNSLISEDINLKDTIRCIDSIATDDFDCELNRNCDKILANLSSDVIRSLEKVRLLITKLATSIDELYGKSKQHELGKELNGYTEQYNKSENMYKAAIESANQRISSLNRSKLFRKQIITNDDNRDDSIRNRIKRNYLEQSINKSNQLVSDLKAITTEFSHQAEISKKTLDILNEDSETLMRTHDTFKNMDNNINTAMRLVGKYNRREIWDRILIAIAFLFFLIVCGYIVIKRVSRKI